MGRPGIRANERSFRWEIEPTLGTACKEFTEATLAANEAVESLPQPTLPQSTPPLPTPPLPPFSQPAGPPTDPQLTSAEAANPTREEEPEDEELDPVVLTRKILEVYPDFCSLGLIPCFL